MTRSAAALGVAAFAVAVVVAGIAAPLGCIPDLPADQAQSVVSADRCGDGVIDLELGEQCDPGPRAEDAGVGGCSSACQMLCDGGFEWSRNHHCYRLVGVTAAALQAANGSAEGVCQQRGGHVVTFASEEEFQAVTGALDAGVFWVGLSPARNAAGVPIYEPIEPSLFEPGWSPACSGCYAHTPDASAPLPVFSGVSIEAGSLGCVVASSDGQQSWQQYPCSVPVSARRRLSSPRVICEQEPVGRRGEPCEAGTCFELVATRGAKQYVYEDTPTPPEAAHDACLAIGGRLVVLQSKDEREQLWRELSLQTVQPYGVWIGLEETIPSGSSSRSRAPIWQWEDEQPADAYPSEWGTAEPRFPGPLSGGRAFLWLLTNEDNTLAHNDLAFSALPYVCEITGATLAARDAGAE